jgi:hypothetical protein
MPVAVVYKTATIPAGQSMSSSVDCTSGAPTVIFLPLEWTPARLSYQVSWDGTNWRDIADRLGKEITVNILPGTAVHLTDEWSTSALGGWVRLRSGSRDRGVAQEMDRVFTVLIDMSVV